MDECRSLKGCFQRVLEGGCRRAGNLSPHPDGVYAGTGCWAQVSAQHGSSPCRRPCPCPGAARTQPVGAVDTVLGRWSSVLCCTGADTEAGSPPPFVGSPSPFGRSSNGTSGSSSRFLPGPFAFSPFGSGASTTETLGNNCVCGEK